MADLQSAEPRSAPSAADSGDCIHQQLGRLEKSGINDVDTDVLLYACSRCGKWFTITDY